MEDENHDLVPPPGRLVPVVFSFLEVLRTVVLGRAQRHRSRVDKTSSEEWQGDDRRKEHTLLDICHNESLFECVLSELTIL